MKRLISVVLILVCMLSIIGCNQKEKPQQENNKIQYYFTAKVIESHEEYLLLEVYDTGNSNLSDGDEIEVSTNVVAAKGCPNFSTGEFARVVMASNPDKNTQELLNALSIYKIEE